MSNPSLALFILNGGLAFATGFGVGSKVFSYVLRQRERRVTLKLKAIEAARVYLHECGVELAIWVADLADQQRMQQPRRWWQFGRRSK